jgi:hypothetical protein|eukprot:COSAG02_NODE_3273_length_7032_cov_32.221405_2_plen_95_part_00
MKGGRLSITASEFLSPAPTAGDYYYVCVPLLVRLTDKRSCSHFCYFVQGHIIRNGAILWLEALEHWAVRDTEFRDGKRTPPAFSPCLTGTTIGM